MNEKSSTKRLISPMKQRNELTAKKAKLNTDEGKVLSACNDTSIVDSLDFLFDEEDFDIDYCAEQATKALQRLDLNTWQRCLVDAVERREKCTFDQVLTVRAAEDATLDKENEVAITKCHLQGPWSHTRVEVGDVVSLLAVWDEQLDAYKVDKDNGYCVTQPDTLISSTNVVGALFCRRKGVLQDRFKGIDANSKVMVIGSLVHELLQSVLTKNLKNRREIDGAASELLESQEVAYMLYGSLLTRDEVAHEVAQFVPKIVDFVEQYVQGREPAVIQKNTFQDTISEVADIEENVWVPQLGLKGKVDVSVRVRRRKRSEHSEQTAIPLELKTGRATFSMEHKGQVILYQMMLSAIGRPTNSGLLLYLREGIVGELQGARNEQRDLILLRNDYAHHLCHIPKLPAANSSLALGEDKFVQPFVLPEPISHHSACGNCAYATICCTYAKTDAELHLDNNHPLQKVMQSAIAHLQSEDYEYFIRWCGLLALEEQETKKSNNIRELWTEAPEVRRRNGRAVLDLQICGDVVFEETRYLHTFTSAMQQDTENAELDLTLCGFSIGEYVIVSTRKRLAIAAGCIYELNKSTISISLERDLHKNYAAQLFIIDKYDAQSSNVFNYTNLGLLLERSERAAVLRRIIVQREQPTYLKLLPKVIATEGASILKQLNRVQRSAVLKALTTNSFMLIKGLPGTGKTQTLVVIVRLLHLMRKSVLITSHTHSAVDNLLMRLKPYNLPLLRLGAGARISSQLLDYSESVLLKDCRTVDSIAEKYASYSIVGVTCLGAAHSIFLHRHFDYCIVDEASQVMQPTILRPLFYCARFILVGDPEQLPPLIRSPEARSRGADESLFERLDTKEATAVLTHQYRMNKTITRLANELTYKGALQCATEEVQYGTLKLNQLTLNCSVEKWVQRALQTHIEQAVFLLDTKNCAERSSSFAETKHSSTCVAIEQSFAEATDAPVTTTPLSPSKQRTRQRISKYTNYCEAAIIFHILRALLSAGCSAEDIGIVAPYRAQVELLRKLAVQHAVHYKTQQPRLDFGSVEVNTVDQYQGRDKLIILYSCAKTGEVDALERARYAEILEDKRRLTVAITRAKHKLLLVGDAGCLQQYTPFRELCEHIPSYCKLSLEDGKQDFNWQQLLDELTQVIGG